MPLLAEQPAEIESLLEELVSLSPIQREAKLSNLASHQRQILMDSLELQSKARLKLGANKRWYLFTRRALQQSTAWQVAAWKAARFPKNEKLIDVCSGVGGDAMALATEHSLRCIERDYKVLECLRWNLPTHRSRYIVIEEKDFKAEEIEPESWLHIDPDRRSSSTGKESRTVNADYFSPSLDQICPAILKSRGSIVKLAPGTPITPTMSGGVHAWISLMGEVREHAWMIGDLVDPLPYPRAAVMIDREAKPSVFCAEVVEETDNTHTPMRYLIDPDHAIRASKLTVAFAANHEMKVLHSPSGFLTADAISKTVCSMAIASEVIWHGSADGRKLKRELRLRDAFVESIKDRTGIQGAAKRLQLAMKNNTTPLTLWLARKASGHGIYAALTKSVAHK